jgi:hypothetical protein
MKLTVTQYWNDAQSPRKKIFASSWLYGIFSAVIFGCIVLVFITFPNGNAQSAERTKVSVSPDGNYTNLIGELKQAGLDPVLRDDSVRRADFSVKGKMISVDNDNMQIFEYASALDAKNEATVFEKINNIGKGAYSWNISKKSQYLFVKDNLVIFYFGNNANIVQALNSVARPF